MAEPVKTSSKVVAPAEALVAKTQVNLKPIVKATADMKIATPEQYADAGQMLNKVKVEIKTFKAERDKIIKPVKALIAAYDLTLKPTSNQLDDIALNIKKEMLRYNEEQSAIAQKQAEALDKKIESGYIKSPETMMRNMEKIATPNNAEAGVTESMVTKVRLVDVNLIPAEYFSRPKVIDALMVELRKDALGNKAQNIAPIVIPGVELYQEKSLSV